MRSKKPKASHPAIRRRRSFRTKGPSGRISRVQTARPVRAKKQTATPRVRTATARIRTINVGALARVEGEGGITIKLKGQAVQDVKVRIYEPPRFFEAFLRKRSFSEVPDITARICGICPVAYQMSSVHAMERAFGITVEGQLRALRRLLYCGEWIESHVLHVAMLHLPDFLGYEDAIQLSRHKPDLVRTALRMKKAGNDIMAIVGGREIHPINVRVGGFYRLPDHKALLLLADELRWGLDAAVTLAKTVAGLPMPDFEQDYAFVALRNPEEYPLNEGRIVSSTGLDIALREYEYYFSESHLEHSNALHSTMRDHGPYLVGPLARFNLNFDRLGSFVQDLAKECHCLPTVRNPFRSIIVRVLETVWAFEEALRIIREYEPPTAASVPFQARESIGMGCTEAPRGILYHRYSIDSHGMIKNAKIVPPTAQNLGRIEADLRAFVEKHRSLPSDRLTWQCEQAVRNYDPCISCATHFVRLDTEPE